MSRELASGEGTSGAAKPRIDGPGPDRDQDQLLLAIETTAPAPGAALARARGADVRVLAEDYAVAQGARAEGLAACIRSVFERASCEARHLSAIAVVDGPGSYTGLRVGLALARGLALVDRVPVVAVGSLELIVEAAACESPTCALLDASQGKVYLGGFERRDAELVVVHEPSVIPASELRARIAEWGGAWQTCADAQLAAELHADVVAPPTRAGTLARVGAARLEHGCVAAAEAVLPRYVGATGVRPNPAKLAPRSAVAR